MNQYKHKLLSDLFAFLNSLLNNVQNLKCLILICKKILKSILKPCPLSRLNSPRKIKLVVCKEKCELKKSSLVLELLDSTGHCVIFCDASRIGLECILMQDRRIYNGIPSMSTWEKLSTHDLELTVIYFAFKI